MTQDQIKQLASEIVGDGQTPNRFFVTTSPYVMEAYNFSPYVIEAYDSGDLNSELIDGYSSEDTETQVFDTFEEAKVYYDNVDLDTNYGVGMVILEDRKTGTICERFLEKIITIDYNQNERDDSKRFGYVK